MLTLMLATVINFTVQTAVHPDDFKSYDTAKIRDRFVMEKVMAPDEINSRDWSSDVCSSDLSLKTKRAKSRVRLRRQSWCHSTIRPDS